MGTIETSAAFGACLLVVTVAVVFDRRPYHPGKRNYIPVMIIALDAILLLGRHLLSFDTPSSTLQSITVLCLLFDHLGE